MSVKSARCLLALFMSLSSATCHFFHEPSAVLLQPTNIPDHSDFGFAMGHWNRHLIVGSPGSKLFGEVYSCPVATISNDAKINCSFVDLHFTTSDYSLENNPNQKFHLGASIATTKDYFFTCAPLVTKSIKISTDKPDYHNAFGSCFIYLNNGTSQQYKGPDHRFVSGEEDILEHVVGGTGWNTLADEVNGILIAAKTSALIGDINYLNIYTPWMEASSLLHQSITGASEREREVREILKGSDASRNVGYGLAAGTFFSKDIVYAFSVQSNRMNGKVLFLGKKKKLLVLIRKSRRACSVSYKPKVVGGMFGYALGAADFNLDGRAELLIGAPAQSDYKDEWEVGALHIYLGGDKIICDDQSRMRTIFGVKEGGRFGTAIAASDIDGDNIPEVFVSAPYEDSGVVYILSGFELNQTLIRFTSFMKVRLTQLRSTQRVRRSELQLLGFSLQVIPDVDGNGCNELAVGAPGSASVLLLRCIQTVNVTIESQLLGAEFVRERDDFFMVAVCVIIDYSSNATFTGRISVNNTVVGAGAYISEPNFEIDLSERKEDPEENCENIKVDLRRHERADYKFITELKLVNSESKDFNQTGVVFSPYSVTRKELDVARHCSGDDCYPDLSMKIVWHGENNETYELGSSETESVSVVVRNDGNASYSACVRARVRSGARVVQSACSPDGGGEWFKCMLLKPLKQDIEDTINLVLNMTQLSNTDTQLVVIANLYEICNRPENMTEKILIIDYTLQQAKKNVHLDGVTRTRNITDKEMGDENILSFKNDLTYWITNNGSIKWKAVQASIVVEKKPFIEGLQIGTTETEDCEKVDGVEVFEIKCKLTLPPDSITKIIAWVDLSKKEIDTYFKQGGEINVTSRMDLTLVDFDPPIWKGLVTEIKLKKELSFGNDKTMIIIAAVFLALFILGIIIYILYKNNFFKRKEKEKLDVLRDSVRRRSVRLASIKQNTTSLTSAANDEHMDIEVLDDSPFEEIPVGMSDDDAELIESASEAHCSGQSK